MLSFAIDFISRMLGIGMTGNQGGFPAAGCLDLLHTAAGRLGAIAFTPMGIQVPFL